MTYDPDNMDRELAPAHGGWIDPDAQSQPFAPQPRPQTPNPRRPPRAARGPQSEQPAPQAPRTADNPGSTPRAGADNRASSSSRPRVKAKARTVHRSFAEWPIVRFVTDRRTWAVCGVLLLCLAAYIIVASISYLRSGIADQSAVNTFGVDEMVRKHIVVENTGGPVGALVAETIFAGGLGLGSLALIVYLSLLGLGLMGVRRCNFWSVTFKTLLVAVAASVVLGLVSLWLGLEVNLGGMHGQYVNQYLIERIDLVGAVLVSVALVSAVIGVYFNDLMRLYNRWRAVRRASRARREQLQYQRELDRQQALSALSKDDQPAEPQTNQPPQPAQSAQNEGTHQGSSVPTPEQPAQPDQPASEPLEQADQPSPETLSLDTLEFGSSPIPEEDVAPDDDITTGQDVGRQPGASAPAPYQIDLDKPSDRPDQPASEQAVPVQQPVQPSTPTPSIPSAPEPPDASVSSDATRTETISAPGFSVYTTQIAAADPRDAASQPLYDPTAELSRYVPPTLELLRDTPSKGNTVDVSEQEENKERITKTLNDYGIPISHIEATVGPTVTLYEIIPAEGVRIAKIKRLEDDIAMSLAALGIRIIAPIPGKGTIGIEVPNKDPQTVSIRSILGSKAFQETHMKLPMAMGATISNNVYIADLAKMPHLLVAGATGMGKSVGLNTIIASLLYKKHPAELKFVLVDPKMVEFSLYSVLERHFLAKLPDEDDAVVTDMDKVVRTLNSLCVEMDQRYLLLKDANVRSVTEYNDKFVKHLLNPEKGHRYLPYIVMVVDEFADLIMTAGKQVETPIARIAQKARAVGMHMIVATQRPSTNVITGIIKANFPGRIAFRVSQMVDSKTILDRTGANQLIGRGDMLFSHNGSMDRVQCAFIDTPEVEAICEHISNQVGYDHAYYLPEPPSDTDADSSAISSLTDRDPLFEEAAQFIVSSGEASTSKLQRRYAIGYNRAGKLMDQMEAAGIVGPVMGSRPRSVLVDAAQLSQLLNNE